MKIAVLVKQVPDTWSDRRLDLGSGLIDRVLEEQVPDEISERALENALRFKDRDASVEVVALSMGPEGASAALRKMLAMGADAAVLVEDPALAGSDMVQTSKVLAAALERIGADLILGGNEATDGRGGIVPAMVAERLGLPYLPALDHLEISSSEVAGTVRLEGATAVVRGALPAVVSVTEKTAEARFPSFKGIMKAKKKPLEVQTLADLGIQAGPASASVRSVMVGAAARPPRQAGPKIVDDGTAAQQLADFLASRQLV